MTTLSLEGDMITTVLRVKTNMHDLADECMQLFNEGARPHADREEHFFALGNTTVQEGYVRVITAQHIAMALEYVLTTYVSINADLVHVEWDGPEDYLLPSGQLLGVIV